MMFPSGQPLLQNGTPQSMQRAAWCRTSATGGSIWTSCQSESRCSTGRYGVSTRPYSRNPVGLAIARPCVEARFERQLQLLREPLHELRRVALPLAEHVFRALAARVLVVPPHHALEDLLVFGGEPFEGDALRIHAAGEGACDAEHVGEAAAHAGAEVAPGRAEDHHAAAGHVLAAVIADAFDDRVRAAVAAAEALARDALEVRLAGRRAVQRHVSRDDVLCGIEGRAVGHLHHELPAREALAAEVVGVAVHPERHAARYERAEALARRSAEVNR